MLTTASFGNRTLRVLAALGLAGALALSGPAARSRTDASAPPTASAARGTTGRN